MVCEREFNLSPITTILVLILVLMEYGLRVGGQTAVKGECNGVLILVLMEYGLRVGGQTAVKGECNGVLILVLMEYGLRASR